MELRDVMKSANRFEVIVKIEQGILKMNEAADLLGLHVRHVRRLRRRVEQNGLKGLLFQRSHKPPNKIKPEEEKQIIQLRRQTYRKYNISHFKDILKEQYGIVHSHEYYRKLFLAKKLCQPRVYKKRKLRHRKRFEAPKSGILIQRDTSIHFWVPGLEKPWKLILDLDDHSRKITGALFSKRDDVLSNMYVSWETVSTHGLPFAYYTDNNPIFNPLNKKPRLGAYQFYRERNGEEKESITQFKRALHELGIECIHATPYQPQGKGKVERIFRFMQDRLVREMETAKVRTIEEANKYLKKWIDWYNHKHVHTTTKQIPNERYLFSDAFKKVPKDIDLEQIFCLKFTRMVKADNTFQIDNRIYQIEPNKYRISYARTRVEIRVYLSRQMKVFYKNRCVGTYVYIPKKNRYLHAMEDILALQ